MNDAVQRMLDQYDCQTQDDYRDALREILQQMALLGLWRSKFFEHAAFYGGTALRVLHGLDRYSEDLDFSLLTPNPTFRWDPYGVALQRELIGFGFEVAFEAQAPGTQSAIASAFLKTNTLRHLLSIRAGTESLRGIHPGQLLKIKLEIDTDPPGGFTTEYLPVLRPVPFAVRVYSLPDLFAGKMHAVLCRKWKTRVKGRDWYDLVWYAGHHPELRLSHLESRLRASGDWTGGRLTAEDLHRLLEGAIGHLNVQPARQEVDRFVRDKRSLELWSPAFFLQVARHIRPI